MRVYRVAGIILLLLLTAVWASAFEFSIHVEITKDGFSDLMYIWAPVENALVNAVKNGFSDGAFKEITEANISKDTKDCGDKSDPDAVAVPCSGLPLGRISAAIDYVNQEPHYEHFDSESFFQASDALFNSRQNIIRWLTQRRFTAARKELGGLLHGLQDFYAHSNYVELNYGERLEDRLGKQLSSFWQGYPQVAGQNDATCNDGSELLERFQHRNPGVPQTGDLLTSGYWVDVFRLCLICTEYFYVDPAAITQVHKCRHGVQVGTLGPLGDVIHEPGINKDNAKKDPGYSQARQLARVHTLRFMMDLLDDPDVRKDPAVILGFMGHPAISSLSAPTAAGLPGRSSFDVIGEGFVSDSVVFWNEEALVTQHVSDTDVRADISNSSLANPDKVQVTVRNPGTNVEDNIVWFSSNPLPAAPGSSNPVPSVPPATTNEPDCPGAVRPHRHDPRLMDVNANRWNDTGLLVKQGQRVNIQVVQGMVVWRAGGLFSGTTGEAAPQGDPTATPGTVLLWVDPPIDYRRVAIGALIGMIVGTDLLDADKKPTIPLTEKPDGVKYFPVLTGGQFVPPMPADGRLYLGINDGAFFNNGGCFQVRVTPVK